MAVRHTVHRRRVTLEDRAAGPYLELPVEVPPGSRSLAVELRYDRAAGVVDLGCLGPEGFRGWSGGARERFVLGPDHATPGYLPGELAPGDWRVLLGLHRVPAAGLDLQVSAVAADRAAPPDPAPARPPPPARPPRRDLPAYGGMRWLAGDLHAHTVHSDGALTVVELACLAAGRGLDFLAVTDHNTVSHHAELAAAGGYAGLTLLPGQEVTTDRGHAGALGPVGWVDFRRPAGDWLAAVQGRGGLLSVNHPLAADCAWQHRLPGPPPLAEVWHSSWWDRRWGGPLAWWAATGPRVVPVGGSDWHRPGSDAPPGTPTTWVLAADGDVLGALAAGRVAVTAGRHGPALLRVGPAELVAVDADGTFLVAPDGSRRVVRGDRVDLPAGPGGYRLEAPDNAVVALCA